MMIRSPLLRRIGSRTRRISSDLFFRRTCSLNPAHPVVSFTFDDFPRTAWTVAGKILGEYAYPATYYTSFGILGQESPCGTICDPAHIADVLSAGHEIGCHTFSHSNAWTTSSRIFEQSIRENQRCLHEYFPKVRFETFSYPISCPHPLNKRISARKFLCARGGGQAFNRGKVDLNHLRSFFLEQAHGDIHRVQEIIERNAEKRGWLIFSTHDVSTNHSALGCSPAFFARVLELVRASKSEVISVANAFHSLVTNK